MAVTRRSLNVVIDGLLLRCLDYVASTSAYICMLHIHAKAAATAVAAAPVVSCTTERHALIKSHELIASLIRQP